ncbi:MAG: phosphatase PAP2 family protein [Candidatus ainarchaeum sp.]|nr:phosphatase PAP2 family protein [Candidatus ainarchaeum sp.]
MDPLSAAIAGIDIGWLTTIATALDNEAVMVLVTLGLVLIAERRKTKVAKIVVAVIFAVLLTGAIKELVHTDRPCVAAAGKIECPDSHSFPSGHTLVAFTVMLAFLNKPVFPLYMLYAIFIAFTRIYLGVHSFEDVAGSVGLAPFTYYMSEIVWNRIKGGNYEAGHKHK